MGEAQPIREAAEELTHAYSLREVDDVPAAIRWLYARAARLEEPDA